MVRHSLIETHPTLVARFYDPLEAEIASGLLKARGVPNFLSGEGASVAFPVRLGRLGQIDLLVRDADASKARRLLHRLGSQTQWGPRSLPPRKSHGKTSSSH